MDYFDKHSTDSLDPALTPLAERMRPRDLESFAGQRHLLGPNGVLRLLIERDRLPSMLFWGEPGSGKTTLARLIAAHTGAELVSISAVSSGVREVRDIISHAAALRRTGRRTILFIDEVHRFNKAQQDALLHAVEDGTLILIGATTENPSFEVIGPLLSRARVFRFNRLTPEEVGGLLDRALTTDSLLQRRGVELTPEARSALIDYSGGDARAALTGLEIAVDLAEGDGSTAAAIDTAIIERALQARPGRYDKQGDYHYDVISAFIKSLRGSDPDAAVYYLARMVEAGEDPLFIARRMVILASEDIGNANPTALVLANACAQAVHFVGMPEAQLILSQTALYLASSPKSNAGLEALLSAIEDVRKDPERPVPLQLRNAVTGLMKAEGYGKGYQYDHESAGGVSGQNHLPEGLEDRVYYHPTDRGTERSIRERLEEWWPKRVRKKKA